MNKISNSPSQILLYAINEAETQDQLTALVCTIHQVSASGSDTEADLIRRLVIRQAQLEVRDMELANQLRARWQAMQNNWNQN